MGIPASGGAGKRTGKVGKERKRCGWVGAIYLSHTTPRRCRGALAGAESWREGLKAPSRGLRYIRRLRSLLTLGDFEFHRVAFLQAFVSVRCDRAVVNEYIWPI